MPSPVDLFFEEIFGFQPAKKGTAYEMLTAAVIKIISSDRSVFHDLRIRGEESGVLHQIDVVRKDNQRDDLIECKDHSDKGKKVGIGEVGKFMITLADITANSGAFFSATDFTEPARRFASASEKLSGKPTELFHMRQSVEEDERGRIKKIVFNIYTTTPEYEESKFCPLFTARSLEKINSVCKSTEITMEIDQIYDSIGNVISTIRDITSINPCRYGQEEVSGSYLTPGGHIKYADMLLEIHGISFKITCVNEHIQTIIEATGSPRILIKSESGSINKLITEEQLKRIQFSDDGSVQIR
jgi:hypothetical protein